jgi:hypothetical protein
MDMALDENFIFPPGIHLMRVRGNDTLTNNVGTHMRCTFQLSSEEKLNVPNGSIGLYFATDTIGTTNYPRTYYANPNDPTNPPYGSNGQPHEYLQLARGRWYRLEMHLKTNSPHSSSNGLMEMWVDGKKVIELSNMKWLGDLDTTNDWREGHFTTWYGGNDQSWAAAQDQSIYFDNIIISENPITHG